jgi:hypothetical protein
VIALPWALPGADGRTVAELNAATRSLNGWLAYSWIATLLLLLSLLAAGWWINRELFAGGARLAGRAAKASGLAKGVCAILAASSFVAAGANAQAASRAEQVRQSAQRLSELQLKLFAKVEDALVLEAVASGIARSRDENPAFHATSAAFNRSIAYVAPALADSPLRDHQPRAGSRPSGLPDLPAQRIEEMSGVLPRLAADEGRDKLVESVFKIASDKAVVGPLKTALLDIENPILSSLADAFLDPLMVDPIRNAARRYALQFMAGRIGFAEARSRMRGLASGVAERLRRRPGIRSRLAPAGGLGQPVWDRLRETLSLGLERGLVGDTAAERSELREENRVYRQARDDLRRLLAGSAGREGERAFANFLERRPRFAAIWGYGVISLPPEAYASDLQRISVGGSAKKVAQIRAAMEDGSPEAQRALRDMGFDPRADRALSDGELAAKLWRVHGPYPIDGYSLYFDRTGVRSPADARAHYQSEPVADAVGRYCPA